jgi:hypothetical protein
VIDGLVYFIQSGDDGPIKIGFTRNLAARLRQLQTGHPAKLRVLRAFRGDERLEAWLHRHFAAHRLNGEWFTPHRDLLRYLVDHAAPERRPGRVEAPPAAPSGPVLSPEELAAGARAARLALAAKFPRKERS